MALRLERNIRYMLIGAVAICVLGWLLAFSLAEWLAVIICCGMVIACELINTAIETVVDLVSPEFHPLAGRAKDIAAAASWVVSLTAALVGLVIVISRAIEVIHG